MKISLPKFSGLALLLALLLVMLPAFAQEDEGADDEEGWGKLIAEWGVWAAEPGGLGTQVATVGDPANIFSNTIVGFRLGSETEDYTRFGAELAGNRGRVLITWYAHVTSAQMGLRDPGNFIYGELLAFPVFAGLANDGLADAVDADFGSALRDQRIEYSRVAFSNSRVEGRWVAGYRKITFSQSTDATYYALVPTFPAFVPPLTTALPNLTPLPDLASIESEYQGRGISGGFEIEAPLYRDKLKIEASLGISLLQGKVNTEYRAINSLYTASGLILEAPYDEFGDYSIETGPGGGVVVVGFASSVQQNLVGTGLKSNALSRSSQVLDASLGVRWSAMKLMDVFFGFRMIQYGDVAVELRPKNAVVIGNTINAVDATEIDRSATYEGFYGGVGVRF